MTTDDHAQTIWSYLRVNHEPHEADVILVPCSNDLRVVDHVAQLYDEGYADTILFSGGVAHTEDLLQTGWDEPEAEVFKQHAIKDGLPADAIMTETHATNTEENVTYSKQRINDTVDTVLLAQKPFSEKRVLATFNQHWTTAEPTIAPSPLTYDEYPTGDITKDVLINLLVGEVQRLIHYPDKNYCTPVHVPDDVRNAATTLINNGYDRHTI